MAILKYRNSGTDVDKLAELKQQIKELADQAAFIEDKIRSKAHTEYLGNALDGDFNKTFEIIGKESGRKVTVTFKDKYGAVKTAKIGEVKELLGDDFDKLFGTRKGFKSKWKGTLTELQALLGEKFDMVFTVTEAIAPVAGFGEKRFEVLEDLASVMELDEYAKQDKGSLSLKAIKVAK